MHVLQWDAHGRPAQRRDKHILCKLTEDQNSLPNQRNQTGSGMLMRDCMVHLLLAASITCSVLACALLGTLWAI